MPANLRKRIFFLLIGFTFHSILCAGQPERDSLLSIIKNSNDINLIISARGSLAYDLMWTDIDSAGKMLESATVLAAKEGNKESRARVLILKGTFYWFSNEYDSALFYYRKGLNYSKQNNIAKQYKSVVANLGALYNVMSIPDSSVHYLNIALELARKSNDTVTLAKAYFDLGSIYNVMQYSNLALENLLKARDYFLEIHDTVTLSFVYTSLGITYGGIGDFEKSRQASLTALQYDLATNRISREGDIFNNLGVSYWQNKRDMDSAIYYLRKSIEKPSTENKENRMFSFYLNVGGVETDKRNFREALNWFHKAQGVKLPYEDQYRQSALLVNLGAVWLFNGYSDSAVYYSHKGLDMALKINAYEYVKNAYKNLYLIDSAHNDFHSAIKHYQLYYNYKDTIASVQVRNKIAELQIIYQTRQKDKENALLITQNLLNQKVIEKQRNIVFTILGAFIIILIFVVLLLRNQKKLNSALIQLRQKNEEIEKKQEEIELKNQHLELQKKELTELNLTKDKFFSIIAHDLKSPFNALLGFLDILENEFDEMDDAEKFEIIKTLHESSENTYSLLINLLDWSRSQRGMVRNYPENLGLREISDSAIGFLTQRAQKKEHHIENLISPEHYVYADQNLTQTVFINLLNNAIKFTPRKGHITLTSEENNGFLKISVRDNGIGIPDDMIPNLFSIESDFNRPGTENEIGTGLGLKMFKEFVGIMGGTISVESEENSGTVFTFTLPASRSKES